MVYGNKKRLAIIQIQGLADLNEKSEWIHQNTKYYDKWNKTYYDAIVKRRYRDSNYDSEEFEKNNGKRLQSYYWRQAISKNK